MDQKRKIPKIALNSSKLNTNFDSSQKLSYERIGHENILNFLEKKDSDLEGCCEKFVKFLGGFAFMYVKAHAGNLRRWAGYRQCLVLWETVAGRTPGTSWRPSSNGFPTFPDWWGSEKNERLASVIKARDILKLELFYLDIG